MNNSELIDLAFQARARAYVPYSKFAVGAALLDFENRVWLGCNIENAAYGPTNCAERTAIFKAVSEGVTQFQSIAIVGGPQSQTRPETLCPPCGVCRQVLREFVNPDSFTLLFPGEQTYTLEQLLPHSFGPKDLTISAAELK
jgi:cytidine deaminase